MSNDYEKTTRLELARIQDRIVWITKDLARAEGIRDGLLRDLQDLDGAHDRRFTVR